MYCSTNGSLVTSGTGCHFSENSHILNVFFKCSEFVVLVQVPVVVEDVALPSAVVAEAEVIRPLRLVVFRLWKKLNRRKCPLDSEIRGFLYNIFVRNSPCYFVKTG